jgi:hypothetical protein
MEEGDCADEPRNSKSGDACPFPTSKRTELGYKSGGASCSNKLYGSNKCRALARLYRRLKGGDVPQLPQSGHQSSVVDRCDESCAPGENLGSPG